jgi:uncharacterized protein with HEPN domain
MIIGEALQLIFGNSPQIAREITEFRSIIIFRDILVHGYDEIDDATVWDIMKGKLPNLHSELEALSGSLP